MEKAFLDSLLNIRKKIRRQQIIEVLSQWAMLSLVFLFLTNIVIKLEPGFIPHWTIFYPGMALFGLILTISYMLFKPKQLLKELEAVDRLNHLDERLGTAYEYYLKQKKSIIVDLLYQDVVQKLGTIGKQINIKKSFNRTKLLILFILSALFLVSFLSFSPGIPDYIISEKKVISKVAQMLKAFSQKKLKIKNSETVSEALQKISDVEESIAKNRLNRDKLLETIDELDKQLVRERKQLMGDLSEQLSAGTDFKPNLAESFSEMESQDNALERIKKQLSDYFDNQLPEDLDRHFEELKNNELAKELMDQIKQELEQAQEDSNQKNQSSNDQMGVVIDDLDGEQASSETNDRQSRANQSSDNQQDRQLRNKDGELSASNQQSDVNSLSDKNRQGDALDNFDSYTAGKEKDTNQKKNQPYELKTGETSPTPTKGKSTQGEGTSTIIQSLMKIGSSKIEAAEVFRQYQEKLEQVMKKEDIPMEHRGMIKDYFLSIGLKTESKRR
ncbi:MAG: hypothetical protein HOC24_07350 [Deltaproteobacteria bacterium]|nr:hypothetical protein [Deltaproteobacteria bacterium]